jgi:Predicted membrane protein (DUF2079)
VIARLLAVAAVLAAAALGGALVLWTGRREHWPWRPEHFFLLTLGLVALRVWLAPRPLPTWRPRRVVAVGVAAYALLFSFVTVTRHFTFAIHALDLGYYVQLGWNLARGAGPYVSLPEMHAWGDHLSPIMYVFVPAFWIAPGAVVLLVAQSAALALGGVTVFGLARARLRDERPAAAFALLYLASPSLQGINVRDFHTAALAIPLLLAAAWAVEAGRPGWALLPAALTLLFEQPRGRALLAHARPDGGVPGVRAGAPRGRGVRPGPVRAPPEPAAARVRLPGRHREERLRAGRPRDLPVAQPAGGEPRPGRRDGHHRRGRDRVSLHGGGGGRPAPAAAPALSARTAQVSGT